MSQDQIFLAHASGYEKSATSKLTRRVSIKSTSRSRVAAHLNQQALPPRVIPNMGVVPGIRPFIAIKGGFDNFSISEILWEAVRATDHFDFFFPVSRLARGALARP